MPVTSLQRESSRASKPNLASPRSGVARPDALEELITAIAGLEEKTIEELRERRVRLHHELSSVDAELAELTGQPGKSTPAEASAPAEKRLLTLSELIAELQAAPGHLINIRKANLEAKTIRLLARAHPNLLKFGGKSGWPTVTLLERPEEKPRRTKSVGPHPDLFD